MTVALVIALFSASSVIACAFGITRLENANAELEARIEALEQEIAQI